MPKQPRNDLTAERVRSLLSYDPENGVFRWKISRGNAAAGSVAAKRVSSRYQDIKIDGRTYQAHRLAWLMVHGRWPNQSIDHINGVKGDNRLCNLRDVSHIENMQNQKRARTNNQSGALGVSPKRSGRYCAQIQANGKKYHLGHFKTIEQAAAAYRRAKREVHPFWHEAPKQSTGHRHL